MNCPLCNSNKSINIKRTRLDELRPYWLASFGFDPFPKDFPSAHLDKKKCMSCQLEYYSPEYFGDARFYEKLSKNNWYYEQNKWEYDVAAEIVSKVEPGNLLEIGCGNGHFLEKIASLALSANGVDINRDAVAVCKRKGLKVDAVNVHEIKDSYDMVVLFQVLEHMEDAKALFEFLATRLVRPGGHLIIAVPNPEGYLKQLDVNLLDMPPHHNSCWSHATFEHLFTQFGLQMIEYKKEPIRYVHYLCLLQSIISDNAKLNSSTWKSKLFNRVQSLVVRMLAPLSYLRDRNQLDGQTHLVLLKRTR